MGERDIGAKTSMMQDREISERAEVDEKDGTLAEVLPLDEIEAHEDEDLREAKFIDEHDTPEDDYVQEGSDFARGVIGAVPTTRDLEEYGPRERETPQRKSRKIGRKP
jgi:hypothetical protein